MNGGVPETVRQMNERAKQLGGMDTTVVTPDGFDEPGQVSSAYDLTLFAREGMKNADFKSYAGTKSAQFPGKPGDPPFGIQNTNTLLGKYQGMLGVKNGYTTNAGFTFIGMAERGGRTLLVGSMNAPTKAKSYDESAKLLDWGFQAAGRVRPVGTLVAPAEKPGQTPEAAASPKEAAGPAKAASAAGDDSSLPWGLWLGVCVPAGLVIGGAVFVVLRRRARADASGFDVLP
jgi:D-alanyl-D-alanine carboxypeptidase (penicillin-binding protein 5/6)